MQKNIIFEDNHMLVAYKPAGIATQTARVGQRDMMSELKNYLSMQPEYENGKEPYLGLIHRLDQPVTGILVFAKTKEAAAALSRQIRDGIFHKYYYAVIYGNPDQKEGKLEHYLYKDCKTNRSVIVRNDFPGAKKAVLYYRQIKTLMVLEAFQETTLVEIELFTGRHHQIRVQMAEAGMSLLGDSKYGREEVKTFSQEIGCRNVALCAYKLEFKHPQTGKKMCFTQMPKEEIFLPFFTTKI